MFLLLTIATVVLLVVYLKLKWFTLRGPIPGIAPHFFVGNLIQSGALFDGKSLAEIYLSFKERFGDTFQLWLGPWRFVVVGNVTDVQHIFTHRHVYDQGDFVVTQFGVLLPDGLITLTGPKYKRHAALTMPLFRRGKIVSNFDLIVDCTDQLLANWRASSNQHVHLDIVQQCQNLLLAIFGLIAFDYDLETLDSDRDSNKNELTRALRDFLSAADNALFMPNYLYHIYLKLSRRHRRARATIGKYINQMIDHELAESPASIAQRKRTCLIASFVTSLQTDENAEASKREEDKKGKEPFAEYIQRVRCLRLGLSRSEVLDEMVAFLIAGYETTSTALAWFIHLMSKHPRVQQKIKAELIGDDQLSLDRLDSLVYLDCVINEVLRFSPPFDGSIRSLTADDRLPESGVQLFAGDQVIIPFHTLAHDPRLWSIDPETFYPERFMGEDKNHHPYASLAFGGGHRQCIGQDLARFELKVIAARLMQQVTFGDGGSDINAGGHLPKFTIIPKHLGVTIEFA